MYHFSSLLRETSNIDFYMKRARALKYEEQVFPREVKHLIRKLEGSLHLTQGAGKRRKIPGSGYAPSEVTERVNALRSVLLAVEMTKRTQEAAGVPTALRERARTQLLKAIVEL